MKTEYNQEIENLLSTIFAPSTPNTTGAVAMTLSEIHTQITNVLPVKWVLESDVYEALQKLDYTTQLQEIKTEIEINDKKEISTSYLLKYFLKLK